MFDVNQMLTIKLDDYQFCIGEGFANQKRYTYTDKLSEREIKEIVNGLMKKHFEEIKAKASAADKKK